jgi:hypothetical protein
MLRRTRLWAVQVAALALVAQTTTDCDTDTFAASTIHYEQIGACNGTPTPTGAVTAGPGAVYVAFRINRIENTMEHARDFEFHPNNLYINEDPPAHADTDYATSMGNPFATFGATVAKGTTADINGAVFVIVHNPSTSGGTVGPYSLLHETAEGTQGAFLVKANSDTASFPYREGCHQLSF